MALNLRPLGDRVVIEPVEKGEETFAGGALVLPETAKEKPMQGIITAVGPGKKDDEGKRIPMDVEVGQIVIYAKYSGTTFKTAEGNEILIVKESDILAIIE